MTKLENLLQKRENAKTQAQEFLDAGNVEKAREKIAEVKQLDVAIENQKELDDLEKSQLQSTAKIENKKLSENASFIRAAIKKMTGRTLTEAENALLLPNTENPTGANGEGYILPQDIQTKIHERIRQLRSMRDVIGSITTTALTGSLVYENTSSIAGLTDFEDGQEIAESESPKFTQVKFALKEKGAIIFLSNVLLTMTDNDLMNYIVNYFAKKAVITENAMAFNALQKGKTVKAIADWKALKSSINKDLDPASLSSTVILTNQDGFEVLDSALDANGRPILQPDPTNPTVKRFIGYEVIVFSNKNLPSTKATASKAGTAPIYYGNLEAGAKFVKANGTQFATDSSAGFTKNVTVARIIELIDCVQFDSSDECYICGRIEVEPKTGTSGN